KKKESEEKYSGHDGDDSHLLADILYAHEEKHDQQAFRRGDGEGNRRGSPAEIDTRHRGCDDGQNHERDPNDNVKTFGRDVCRHESSLCVLMTDQVEQRVQINPHQVDEVPVQPGVFDRVVVIGAVFSTPGEEGNETYQHYTDQHVQRVQAGHGP